MKYFEEIDAWLTTLLEGPEEEESGDEWFARAKSAIKDKILESYRNGQKAGPKAPSKMENEKSGTERRFPAVKRNRNYRRGAA